MKQHAHNDRMIYTRESAIKENIKMITPRKEHIDYYLQLAVKAGSLSPVEKKDLIALLALFYEELPKKEEIPERFVNIAIGLRNLLRPRLQGCGFFFTGDPTTKKTDKDIKQYTPLVLKLAYAYYQG